MIEKPEDITQDQFAMFMVNSLAKALHDWITSYQQPLLKREYKHRYTILASALKNYNDLHQADAIEDLYEVHDELQHIMGFIQRFNKGNNPAGAWSLLSMCTIYASGNLEELTKFHADLGKYILAFQK